MVKLKSNPLGELTFPVCEHQADWGDEMHLISHQEIIWIFVFNYIFLAQ